MYIKYILVEIKLIFFGRPKPANFKKSIQEMIKKLKYLANKIIEELDSKSTIEYLDFRKGDVLHSLADLSTTKQLIDYNPQFSLSEGLSKTISFYKN